FVKFIAPEHPNRIERQHGLNCGTRMVPSRTAIGASRVCSCFGIRPYNCALGLGRRFYAAIPRPPSRNKELLMQRGDDMVGYASHRFYLRREAVNFVLGGLDLYRDDLGRIDGYEIDAVRAL